MPALFVALAMALATPLTAAEATLADAAPQAAAEAVSDPLGDMPFPAGAPRNDYGLVAWCYGALNGYISLHDQVMPEVTRIESTYRRPGSKLADDLRVYDDLQKTSRANLKLFTRAMEAAEKASLHPLSAEGADAISRGNRTWAGADKVTKARLAQEWMGWTLPARCTPTAQALEERARLMGPALQANEPTSTTQSTPADEPAPPTDHAPL